VSLTAADEDDGAESVRGLADFSLRVSGFREGGGGGRGGAHLVGAVALFLRCGMHAFFSVSHTYRTPFFPSLLRTSSPSPTLSYAHPPPFPRSLQETFICLVLDLVTGGELFDRIIARGTYTDTHTHTHTHID
jgi:hypothetical protein